MCQRLRTLCHVTGSLAPACASGVPGAFELLWHREDADGSARRHDPGELSPGHSVWKGPGDGEVGGPHCGGVFIAGQELFFGQNPGRTSNYRRPQALVPLAESPERRERPRRTRSTWLRAFSSCLSRWRWHTSSQALTKVAWRSRI